MRLILSPQYDRMYKELERHEQDAVDETLGLFQEDPFHPSLVNHALWRGLTWFRAISVDRDLRIVFTEKGSYFEVTLIRVWPHDKVYAP